MPSERPSRTALTTLPVWGVVAVVLATLLKTASGLLEEHVAIFIAIVWVAVLFLAYFALKALNYYHRRRDMDRPGIHRRRAVSRPLGPSRDFLSYSQTHPHLSHWGYKPGRISSNLDVELPAAR